MIRLNPTPDPRKIDLGHGVGVTVAPLTSAIFAAARVDPSIPSIEEVGVEACTVETVKAIARRTILAWEGVGDLAGNPVDPTPDWIDGLLSLWAFYEAFNDRFVGPALLLRDEGNGSAPSPTGTLAGAPDTADTVPGDALTAPTI